MFLRTSIAAICYMSFSLYSMECGDKVVPEEINKEWLLGKLNEYRKVRESKQKRDNEIARLQRVAQSCDVVKCQLTTRIGIVHGSELQAKL